MKEKVLKNLEEIRSLVASSEDKESIEHINTLIAIATETEEDALAKFEKGLINDPVVLKLSLLNELNATALMITSDTNLSDTYSNAIDKYILQVTNPAAVAELPNIQSEFRSTIVRPIQLTLLQSMIQSLTKTTPSKIEKANTNSAQTSQPSATGKGQSGFLAWTSNLASKASTLASGAKTKIVDYAVSSSSPEDTLLDSLKKYHSDLSGNKNLTYSVAKMQSLLEQYKGLTAYPPAEGVQESKKVVRKNKRPIKEGVRKNRGPIVTISEPKARDLSLDAHQELLKFQELQNLNQLNNQQLVEFQKVGISEETLRELTKMKTYLSDKAKQEFAKAGVSSKALEELQKMGNISSETIDEFVKIGISKEALTTLREQSRVERFQRIGVFKDDLKELTTISADLFQTDEIRISAKALDEFHQSKLSIRACKELEDLEKTFEGMEWQVPLLAYQKSSASEETLKELESTHLSTETLQEFEKAGISSEALAKIQRSEKCDLQGTQLSVKALKELQKPKLSQTTIKELQERKTLAELKEQNAELKEQNGDLDKKIEIIIGELNGYFNLAEARTKNLEKNLLSNLLISAQMEIIEDLKPSVEEDIKKFKELKAQIDNTETEEYRSIKLKEIHDSLNNSYKEIIQATALINKQLIDLAEKAQINASSVVKQSMESENLTDQNPAASVATSSGNDNTQDKLPEHPSIPSLAAETETSGNLGRLKKQNEELETTYYRRVEKINVTVDSFATTRAVISEFIQQEPTAEVKKEPEAPPLPRPFVEVVKGGLTTAYNRFGSLIATNEAPARENKSSRTIDKLPSEETAFQTQIRLTKSNLLSNSAFMEKLKNYDALIAKFNLATKTKKDSLEALSSNNAKTQINDSERLRQQNEAIANANKMLKEVKNLLPTTVETLNELIAEEDQNRKHLIKTELAAIDQLILSLNDLSAKTSHSNFPGYRDIIVRISKDSEVPLDIDAFEKGVRDKLAKLNHSSKAQISIEVGIQKEKIKTYISAFEKKIIAANKDFLELYLSVNSQLEILDESQQDFWLAQIKAKNPLVLESQAVVDSKLIAKKAVADLRKRLNTLTKPELDEQKQPKPVCYNLNEEELRKLLADTTERQKALALKSSNLKTRAASQEVKIVRDMMKVATENLPIPSPDKSGMKKNAPASEVLTNITEGLQNQLDAYFTLESLSKTTKEARTEFISDCIFTMYQELSEENLMKLSSRNEAQIIVVEALNTLMKMLSDLAKLLKLPMSSEKPKFNSQFFASPTEEKIAKAAENAHTQLNELQAEVVKLTDEVEKETNSTPSPQAGTM